MAFSKKLGVFCVAAAFFCQATAEECPYTKNFDVIMDKLMEDYGCESFAACWNKVSKCNTPEKVEKNFNTCFFRSSISRGILKKVLKCDTPEKAEKIFNTCFFIRSNSREILKEAHKELRGCGQKMEDEKASKKSREEERKKQEKALKEGAWKKKLAVAKAEEELTKFSQDFPESVKDQAENLQRTIEDLKYAEALGGFIEKLEAQIEKNEAEYEEKHLECINLLQVQWQKHRRKLELASATFPSSKFYEKKFSFLNHHYTTCMKRYIVSTRSEGRELQKRFNAHHAQLQREKAEKVTQLEDLLKNAPEEYKKQMASHDESLKRAYQAHVDAQNEVFRHFMQKFGKKQTEEAKSKMWVDFCFQQKQKIQKQVKKDLAEAYKTVSHEFGHVAMRLRSLLKDWPQFEAAKKECEKERKADRRSSPSHPSLVTVNSSPSRSHYSNCLKQAEICKSKKAEYCTLFFSQEGLKTTYLFKTSDVYKNCQKIVPSQSNPPKARQGTQ